MLLARCDVQDCDFTDELCSSGYNDAPVPRGWGQITVYVPQVSQGEKMKAAFGKLVPTIREIDPERAAVMEDFANSMAAGLSPAPMLAISKMICPNYGLPKFR